VVTKIKYKTLIYSILQLKKEAPPADRKVTNIRNVSVVRQGARPTFAGV
jgi:hypothetical protein